MGKRKTEKVSGSANMLETLRRIVQEVNEAEDLNAALAVMAARVKQAMTADVCSIYLIDRERQRYVLMATEGLNKAAIGKVSLGLSEGLVGQVGQRSEPINLEDASTHPKFLYLPETGEERYSSFLGVPIIHQRKVLGVLVIQQVALRRFDESEEAFLVTMSAQLAGVIAHAEATGSLAKMSKSGAARFEGISGCPGIGMGTAYVIYPTADLKQVPTREADSEDSELGLFEFALGAVREDVTRLAEKAGKILNPEERALFDVYSRMLDDSALGGEIRASIKKGNWAQGAVADVVLSHIRSFEQMEDSYLRERAADVRDLGLRVLSYLQAADSEPAEELPDKAILIGEDLTTTHLLELPKEKIAGIVSLQGSINSHMTIVARSLGIPTVVGIHNLPLSRIHRREVVVDGYRGEVISNLTGELKKQYKRAIKEEQQRVAGLEAINDLPAQTKDGHLMHLWVNTGLLSDAERALRKGAEGVGLFRTEIPFMVRDRFPSEAEQREIYRAELESFAPHPVTMRTLDVGGDKALPYFPIEEANPALGWRGIRVTLDHPEIFLVQVRAMLWASEGLDNLRILLPMISSVVEVEEALNLVHRAYLEVLEEGAHIMLPPIGAMIEVPAAVYQTADIAQRVDFLSVGTNDLTQYLLAVDRNNRRVSGLYNTMHPAVLRALQYIHDAAKSEETPVSICGEMAGDPAATVMLMAMGYDTLSMSASSLLRVKWAIRNIGYERAKELLQDVWGMDNAAVINSYLELRLTREGLGDVLKRGR